MYKDLVIWHKSMDLVQDIYNISDILPKTEDYNLKSQIRRAMVSVVLNIAEGKSRNSSKDFAHFLNIASASLTEVEVVLEICIKLNYLSDIDVLQEKILELNKMINSLRSKLLTHT